MRVYGSCSKIYSHFLRQQLLPFYDADVVKLFFMDIEPLIHQAVRA